MSDRKSTSALSGRCHSPDSLEKVLTTIGGFARRRVITVLGAGGDRDTTKRAPMGQIAGKHSDLVVVTNDNPRSEDPEAIADQLISGAAQTDTEVERILDREAAIRRALTVAEPEDTVLIAGKGAEQYQIIGAMTIHFNDMETVRKLTANLPAS